MNFAEKLQFIRKNHGYTQEELADKLDCSRQAVAKWEAGAGLPDIDNLIRISSIFNVTIDYLVKDNTCEVRPSSSGDPDIQELIDFRLEANVNTYAAFADEIPSSRLDSHDYRYDRGDYTYIDTYVGGEIFAGEEACWRSGKALYAMNYSGRVLDGRFSGNFLKEALRAADRKMPYRGPEYYSDGEYVYKAHVNGDIAWFQGCEEIWCGEVKVYECYFHGGLMK